MILEDEKSCWQTHPNKDQPLHLNQLGWQRLCLNYTQVQDIAFTTIRSVAITFVNFTISAILTVYTRNESIKVVIHHLLNQN